jgi:hypothetical protein
MEIPSELIAAKKLAEWGILALPGVVGIGIGMREENDEFFDELAVRVYVADKSSIPLGIPEVIGGVGVCIVEALIEPIAQDDGHYNPLVGGIKIEKPSKGFGTLGAIVQDSTTGELIGLSNYHVVGNIGAIFPDTIWQPKAPPIPVGSVPSPDDNIGGVIRVDFPQTPPLPFSPVLAGLTDSAVFNLLPALNQGRSLSSNVIGQDAPTILIDRITAIDFPTVGEFVSKRGFVTRLTEGFIIDASMTCQWSPGGANSFLIEQAVVVGSSNNSNVVFCLTGDSGSVVMKKDSATAVGLLWGNSHGGIRGYMSFISNVQSQLGVNVVWI